MSEVSLATLEDLLDQAVTGGLGLTQAPDREEGLRRSLLTDILCLAILGAECRDHAAANPRGQIRHAVRAANQKLKRFA